MVAAMKCLETGREAIEGGGGQRGSALRMHRQTAAAFLEENRET